MTSGRVVWLMAVSYWGYFCVVGVVEDLMRGFGVSEGVAVLVVVMDEVLLSDGVAIGMTLERLANVTLDDFGIEGISDGATRAGLWRALA